MSYADDNTPYASSENIDVSLEKLEEVGKVFFEWFSNGFYQGLLTLFFFWIFFHKICKTKFDDQI